MQDCINSDNTICRSRLSGVSLAGICLVLTLVLAPGTSATAVAQLPDFTELVKKVSPAVVHIKTSKPSRQLFRKFNGQGIAGLPASADAEARSGSGRQPGSGEQP